MTHIAHFTATCAPCAADMGLLPAMRRHPFNAPTSGPDDCLDCGGSYHVRHDGRPIHADRDRVMWTWYDSRTGQRVTNACWTNKLRAEVRLAELRRTNRRADIEPEYTIVATVTP